jgi:hypothetical protein
MAQKEAEARAAGQSSSTKNSQAAAKPPAKKTQTSQTATKSSTKVAEQAEADTPTPSNSAELAAATKTAVQAMVEANAVVGEMRAGGLRSAVEGAIASVAEALKGDSPETIRAQTDVLVQLTSELGKTKKPETEVAAAIAQPEAAPAQTVIATPSSQKRVALVIGNSAYQNAVELPNPRNDARAVSATLRGLGFEVVEGEDLTKSGMDEKVQDFADKVGNADVALFFYAGHGMQISGRNYLVPIDAKLERPTAADFETIDADRILGYMSAENRIAIALLDACRDNPLARTFARSLGATRSGAVGRGLAVPSTSGGGLLIGFATAPGDVASDGDGANSPFTSALIRHLPAKGLEIEQVLKRVKADVIKETGNQQRPWVNSDIAVDLYLNPE